MGSVLGDIVAGIGKNLGLPEFGISEALGGTGSTNPVQDAVTQNFANIATGQNSSPQTYSNPGTTTDQSSSVASTDPYAAYGGTTAYNNLLDSFNTQNAGILSSSQDAANNLGGDLGLNLADTLHGLTTNQAAIDKANVQNDTSRIQGNRDILSMIGQGVQSGGVRLAQGNAGQSSAAQAIANAYAKLGQQQASSIGQQYAQKASDIGTQQAEQNYQVGQAPAKFHQGIIDNVNNIVTNATQRIQQLQQAMAYASLPNRINLDQEVQSIRDNALSALQGFDSQFQQGVSGIAPASADQNLTSANSLLAAGQADPNLFQYNTTPSAVVQNNAGPVASDLPLFTNQSKKVTA